MAKLDSFSRFRQTPPLVFDGERTYGIWRRPSWLIERPAEDLIKTFRVTTVTEGRPDLIANAVYQEPLLDWVIIAFNKPIEVLNWPHAGDLIEYPAEAIVFSQL